MRIAHDSPIRQVRATSGIARADGARPHTAGRTYPPMGQIRAYEVTPELTEQRTLNVRSYQPCVEKRPSRRPPRTIQWLGSTVTIAFLDVDYKGTRARAACVLADSWEAESPSSTYLRDIEAVAPYESGNFYRRELPCLLSILRLLPSLPETVVVDGYVWLSSTDRPGLGARLYEALGRGTPVVGIAKTAFAGVESCAGVVRVLRGTSRSPLFVTAAGIDPEVAAQLVRGIAGKHRIPQMMRIADRLARSRASTGQSAA